MRLSLRLQTICDLIRKPCQVVVDIGYDHGKILHFACQHFDAQVIGVERAPHFSIRYQQQYPGDQVEFRTGDGLQPLTSADPADVLILSGLGEECIRKILTKQIDYVHRCRQILFCCSSIDLQLRPYLNSVGWHADNELLIQERSKIYAISSFKQGAEACVDAQQCAIGPRLFEHADPLLPAYLRFLEKRFSAS